MTDPRGVILKDEEYLPVAKNLVLQAKKSIFVSSFKVEITTKKRGQKLADFFALLAEKSKDRVDVRVLTNSQGNQGHVPHTNSYAIRYMKKNKIRVRCLQNNRIAHAKLLIVDEEVAIIGSHNLSVKSCHNNFELSYVISNNQLVPYLASIFVLAWYGAKEP